MLSDDIERAHAPARPVATNRAIAVFVTDAVQQYVGAGLPDVHSCSTMSTRTFSWWYPRAHVVGISKTKYVLATSRCLEWRYDRQRTSTSSALRSPGYQGNCSMRRYRSA